MPRRSRVLAWLIAAGIFVLIALTARGLAGATRIGLEFRGGYELLFVATPTVPGGTVSPADLLATARELAHRANASGIAEPEVRVESPAQIRVLLAGVEAGNQAQTLLKGPPLPVNLQVKWTNTVGGVLGAADFSATVKAGAVALGAICLLLLAVYRTPALFAVVGLSAYLWVVLGVFNAMQATLSLAAIVAFVLGVGIAADANILIFERLREEHRHPGSERQILWRAMRAAGRTIFDASLATLIVALVLFAAGIGPIRGFALMTVVGVVASLACNLGLVGALHLLVARDSDDRVAVEALPARTIGFLRAAPYALVLAVTLMAAGAWSIATRPFNYDIDFKAGTALDVDLAGQSISKEDATDTIAGSGIGAATVAIAGAKQDHVEARFDNALPPEKIARIVDQFKTDYGDTVAYQENTADPAVARDLVRQAFSAVGLALVALAALVTWRFGWSFAVATMSCVLVSSYLVVAVFSLFHLEIDVTFIAAILTVMGYAVNDSVVTFDRLRDNLRGTPWSNRSDLRDLVNLSVTQVLRRSLLTLATVMAGAASLYFLGAEPLQMFSLAIFIGLACVAFTTIFVAVPVWFAISQGRVHQVTAVTGHAR
jgi:preprotein translocase SecF subunit